MMVDSTLSKAGWQVLKREDRIGSRLGSRLQDLIGDFVVNFCRVCGIIETKDKRVAGEDGSRYIVGEEVEEHASLGSETERHL